MKGNSRNLPCACGSGKKQKKCHPGMKPREEFITIDCGSPFAMTGVELLQSGEIRWVAGEETITPAAAWHETRYERPKGPKVLNRIPLRPTHLTVNAAAALSRYQLIFAVDTNTRLIDGEAISIGAVVVAEMAAAQIRCTHLQALEVRGAIGNPERVMWRLVTTTFAPNVGTPTALIVDSELSLLQRINAREDAIEGSDMLPDGWSLIYGSADAGADLLPNHLIRECDKRSTQLFARLSEPGLPPLQNAPAHESFTRFRAW